MCLVLLQYSLLFIIFAVDLSDYRFLMALQSCEEFRTADMIIDAVCEVGGISYFDFILAPKSTILSTLRGVCCLVAWDYGVHARRMAKLMQRTRGHVLNQQRTYRNLLQAKDKLTVDIYNKVRDRLKLQIHGKV